jgi:hypothetical protein
MLLTLPTAQDTHSIIFIHAEAATLHAAPPPSHHMSDLKTAMHYKDGTPILDCGLHACHSLSSVQVAYLYAGFPDAVQMFCMLAVQMPCKRFGS